MKKIDLEKLYKETNKKFIGRIENMLYSVCGCDIERGKIILEECLKRNKRRINFKKMETAQEIIDNCDEKLTKEEIKAIESKVRKEIVEENKKEE